ncbi:MAG: hypothetical protein ACUVWP_00610 [bacterium]
MRFIILLFCITILTFIAILSCGDTIYPSDMARRYVYLVSEEDITGHGGYYDIVELNGITENKDEMPVVIVYGDNRNQTQSYWKLLSSISYHIEEARIFIDTNSGNSDYYRIVVIK